MTSALHPILLLALMGTAVAASEPAGAPPPAPIRPGDWVFTLIPKTLQKDPAADMAIITEFTAEGKRLRRPTADRPAYYLAQSAGYHDEGQGIRGEKPLPVDQLQARLERSLAASHHLRSDAAHPATLALIFIWGAANKLDPDPNPNSDGSVSGSGAAAEDLGHRNLLARASLVGGAAFAKELEAALLAKDRMRQAGMRQMGPDPVDILMDKNPKYRQLVAQALDDCYYVVASAYDAASIPRGHPVLLWRTKMTTPSLGLSMAESLPTLIESAGPYFGVDMTEAATVTRRVLPEGRVELGTPVEVGSRPRAAP